MKHAARVALVFVFAALVAAAAQAQPSQTSNKEIRQTASRVGERASKEFLSAWSEHRSIVDLGGKDDGTRLTSYLLSACPVPKQEYWRDISNWLVDHSDTGPGVKYVPLITTKFRKRTRDLIRQFDKLIAKNPEEATVLLSGEKVLTKPKSWETDLRQRAEILTLYRNIVSQLAATHEAKPTDIGDGLAFALWRRVQCEYGDNSAKYLKEYLATEIPELDQRTQLALVIVFANIHDVKRKGELFEKLKAAPLTRGLVDQLQQSLRESKAVANGPS